MKPWEPTNEEKMALAAAIEAARQVQTFLWGEANGEWGLEEWLRMFRKRVAKLEEVKKDNPHAAVELKKRLLQTAALSVALIGIIDRDEVPWEAKPGAPASNLPKFAKSPDAPFLSNLPKFAKSPDAPFLSFEIFEDGRIVGNALLKLDWTKDQIISEFKKKFSSVVERGSAFVQDWPTRVSFTLVAVKANSVPRLFVFKASPSMEDACECWEGVNDREGMLPCEHERLPEGGGPFGNTREPGICRCGAVGPPWEHEPGCAYD